MRHIGDWPSRGDGSRADSQITLSTPPLAGFHPADLIAEAQRSTQGTASSKASTEISVFVKQTTSDPMKIDFHATVDLLAQAEATASEHAIAEAGYVIDIAIMSTDATKPDHVRRLVIH